MLPSESQATSSPRGSRPIGLVGGGIKRAACRSCEVALLVCFWSVPAIADQPAPRPRPPLRVDSEVEYYLPTHPSRAINTLFTNALVGVALLRGILILEAGLTATAAWGSITQWDANFNNVVYPITVGGAGPIVLIRCERDCRSRYADGGVGERAGTWRYRSSTAISPHGRRRVCPARRSRRFQVPSGWRVKHSTSTRSWAIST